MICIYEVLTGIQRDTDVVSDTTWRKIKAIPNISHSLRQSLDNPYSTRFNPHHVKDQVLEMLTKLHEKEVRSACFDLGISESQLECAISRLKKADHSIEMILLINSEKFELFRKVVDPKLCLTAVFDTIWPSSSSFTGQHESLESVAIFAIELGCPVNARMAHAHSSTSKKWLRRFQDFDTGINAFNDDLDREWRCEKIEIKYILYDFFPDDEIICPIIMSFAYRDL